MKFYSTDKVHLSIPRVALVTIFDECDGFEQDETGGRVIGTFQERRGKLDIHVTGIIEAGPQARRSRVSFFQDGEYQERVFRKIEDHHREVEHLGNWHTHHVNGLDHLSDGDIETYYRTVNHHNQNTPFFYALLVTARHRSSDPLRRYTVKHYIFRRGDERIYELHRGQVEIVDAPLIWPVSIEHQQDKRDNHSKHEFRANPNRVYDNDILSEFYRGVRPFSNAKLGVYWRGPLELANGGSVEVVVLEDSAASHPTYTVTLREPPAFLKELAEEIANVEFPSARAALITTERSCNRALCRQRGETHRVDFSA
jgi:integrative and conjugative element protein (TIGR02256 family)